MPGRTVSPVFIGRADELAAAAAVLDRSGADSASHVLVSGEAGVGKTRFTRELAHLADERGFRVLRGGCISIGGMGLPFAPFAAALRDGLTADDLAALAAVDGRALAALASLVPGIAEIAGRTDVQPMPPSGPVTDENPMTPGSRAGLFEALVRLFRQLSATGPILLVIEDLHWSDPATRDVITYLVPSLLGDRIVFCLTYRTDELDRRHPLLPWLAEVGRTGRFERIDLERFSRDDTARVVEAILGTGIDRTRLVRLHQRTDGNAFFLEELLMAGAGGAATGPLPPTVAATLIARIAAAPDAAQRILRVAAVAGRRVDHELLAEVAGLPEDELTEGLRTAIDRQLLIQDGEGVAAGYAFRHALVQEAAYDDVLPGERRSLHRAYAEALEQRSEPAGAGAAGHWAELAHHWAAARDDVRAARAAIRAGDAAFDAFAFMAALRQYEAALGLWDSVPDPETELGLDRIALLGKAASSAEVSGDFRRMAELLREAIAIEDTVADPTRGALLRAQLGRALWLHEGAEPALAQLEAAMALLPADQPTADRARVLAGVGQILMLVDRFVESIAHCEEAVRIAREVGDRQVESHAMNTLGVGLAGLGHCSAGVAALETALAIAHDIGSAEDIARSYVNLTDALRICARDREGIETVSRAIVDIERAGATGSYGPIIRENGVLLQYEVGDWNAARAWEIEAERFPQLGRTPPLYHLGYTILLAVGRGDADVEQRLDRFAQLLEGEPVEGQYHGSFVLGLAEHELWSNRPGEASEAVRAGLDLLEANPFPHYVARVHAMGVRAAADLAEQLRAQRLPLDDDLVAGLDLDVAHIRELIEAHGPDAGGQGELIGALRTAEADRTRALGASDPDAWRAAIDAWTARDRAYDAAYAQWRLAEALLASGDRPGARDALIAAHAWASAQGAKPLATELIGLARRSRLALTSDDRETGTAVMPEAAATEREADRFGLTAREREVLGLVAVGLTNRQIAERLFISENTAGVHVSNILGKLGVSSRTEAATTAIRLGLVSVAAEA